MRSFFQRQGFAKALPLGHLQTAPPDPCRAPRNLAHLYFAGVVTGAFGIIILAAIGAVLLLTANL